MLTCLLFNKDILMVIAGGTMELTQWEAVEYLTELSELEQELSKHYQEENRRMEAEYGEYIFEV